MNRLCSFVLGYAHALACAVYVFTLGLFSPRHRQVLRSISEHFGYRRHVVPPRLPTVAVAQLLAPDIAIQTRAEAAALGNVSLLELVVLDKLLRMYPSRGVFEIGTFDGRTTLNLAANAPAGARVFTLDLPRAQADQTKYRLDRSDRFCVEKERSGARFVGTDLEPVITQLYGDSATFDFGPYRGQIGFVFVDGAHSYEYVLSDSRNALELLPNRRGVIAWHDYGVWDGVTAALNELHQRGGEFGKLRHVEQTSLAVLILA